MRNIFIILISFASALSCSKNVKGVELKVLNSEIVCFESGLNKDTVSIVKYCVTNNSNKTYYFNNIIDSRNLYEKKGVYYSGRLLRIFEEKGNEINYNMLLFRARPAYDEQVCQSKKILEKKAVSKMLGYDKLTR